MGFGGQDPKPTHEHWVFEGWDLSLTIGVVELSGYRSGSGGWA